jgi:hypothetical protein
MEASSMRDLILQCAGAAGILVAIIHGVLGETKVFAKATIQPERLRTLIRLVWQAGTVAWIGGGVLLLAARRGFNQDTSAALVGKEHTKVAALESSLKPLPSDPQVRQINNTGGCGGAPCGDHSKKPSPPPPHINITGGAPPAHHQPSSPPAGH